MKTFLSSVRRFAKREAVLCISVALALISICFVPPGPQYADYIDWNTLAQLFSLMAVMKGFQSAGVFSWLAGLMLRHADSARKVVLTLVFLPFVLSMLITNDVALITFVPFALVVLRLSCRLDLALPVVALQTLAANLGSMLTPMGNPQNLYLYAGSGMSFGSFILLMAPYCALAAAGLAVSALFFRNSPVSCSLAVERPKSAFGVTWPCIGFAVCMLGLFNVIYPWIVAAALFVFLLFADRGVLGKVDYSLLITFVALFVFIGNLGNIPQFKNFLSSVIAGNEVVVSVLACQVISNVPAALLLSGFSSDWSALIVGCNLGGLGTLIASMASLISYKEIARAMPEKRVAYLGRFTLCNVAFLGPLIALYYILQLF